jgi:hypothetical protein
MDRSYSAVATAISPASVDSSSGTRTLLSDSPTLQLWACAERLGAEVLTFDRRDFDVVAGEGTFRVVP